jgi:hypothetical protein
VSGCNGDGALEPGPPEVPEVVALLERALEMIDRLQLPPQIGARIQDAIETLKAMI